MQDKGNFIPYKNLVVLGIGANIGDCLKTFQKLYLSLKRNSHINIISTSHVYKNPPFGYTNQPYFYNATLILKTNLGLNAVYRLIFYLERKFGRPRVRAFKDAPRTLDIDMILFNNLKVRLKHLRIPHYDFHNRESVLRPLIFQLGFFK